MKKILGIVGRSGWLVVLLALLVWAWLTLRTFPRANTPAPQGENGYPPPAQPLLAAATSTPTAAPLAPHPPDGWPTDSPPSSSMTDTPAAPHSEAAFPTPGCIPVAESVPEDTLQELWYPFHPNVNSRPLLQKVLLDANGFCKTQPEVEVDIGLSSAFPGPSLSAIHLSPDGNYLALEETYGESTQVYLLDLKTQRPVDTAGVAPFDKFYAWAPEEAQLLVQLAGSDPQGVSKIDLTSGERTDIQLPAREGISPNIYAFSFSPDGRRLVAGVTYPLPAGEKDSFLLEIGLWDADLRSREVLCPIEGGDQILPSSLQWSPDGQYLLWISGHMAKERPSIEDEFWLWVSQVNTRDCQKVYRLGSFKDYTPGAFSAAWSPTSRAIAFTAVGQAPEQPKQTSSIYLYELNKGTEQLLVETQDGPLSHVSFSPNGGFVAYTLNKGDYGEMWVTGLETGDSYPIAGPTTAYAPYIWLE